MAFFSLRLVWGEKNVHMSLAGEQRKNKFIKIYDYPSERGKVEEAGPQTTLEAVSSSWICRLRSPLGTMDASGNMRHTQIDFQTNTPKRIQSGMLFWRCTHTNAHLNQHNLILNGMSPTLQNRSAAVLLRLEYVCNLTSKIAQSASQGKRSIFVCRSFFFLNQESIPMKIVACLPMETLNLSTLVMQS